jgi:hypothetical protein
MKARKVSLGEHIKEISNRTSLEVKVEIGIQMADYDNWDNGSYNGDPELIKRQVDSVISTIERWVEDNYVNPIRKENEK